MIIKYFIDILIVTLLLASSQVFLKLGLDKIGGFTIHFNTLLSDVIPLVKSFHIWMGVLCTFIGALFWLTVLSKIELSVAYPLISLSYVFGYIAAIFILGESVSFVKFVGVGAIMLGVFLITR